MNNLGSESRVPFLGRLALPWRVAVAAAAAAAAAAAVRLFTCSAVVFGKEEKDLH